MQGCAMESPASCSASIRRNIENVSTRSISRNDGKLHRRKQKVLKRKSKQAAPEQERTSRNRQSSERTP